MCTHIAVAQTKKTIEVTAEGNMLFYGGNDYGTNSYDIRFGDKQDWSIEYYFNGLNFWQPNVANGDGKLFLHDNGNVGIGTLRPESKLHVVGTGMFNGDVTIGKDASKANLNVRGGVRALDRFVLEGTAANNTSAPYWNAAYLDISGPYGQACLYPHADVGLDIGKGDRRVQVYARQVWSVWFTNTSDERIKENVHAIATPLTKITKLKGVQYDVKKSHLSDSAALLRNGKRDARKDNLGFLAQDLQKVFPELVLEQDSTGLLGINYIGLIPVLVEALKEQQVQIAMLQQQVATLSITNNTGKLKSGSAEAETTTTTSALSTGIVLYQNSPNPFSTSTEISMELPKEVLDAQLTVYNLAGEQRLSIVVTDRGAATVRIEAGQLKPGIYIYGIIADGQLAVSKQMVVTE